MIRRPGEHIRRVLRQIVRSGAHTPQASCEIQPGAATATRARILTEPLSARTTDERLSEAYWSRHNVTAHRVFNSVAESLAYFDWRNDQYPGYIDLMPVSGCDGKVVLDFGCGPANDLVGFGTFSKPANLIGMDVSGASLAEAESRLRLHGIRTELVKINERDERIPLPDEAIDYLHCSGVLMTVADPLKTLCEFRRVLREGGIARLMVYNYDSIWLHLYVAYILRAKIEAFRTMSVMEVFLRSTDGAECPINRCWTADEFLALGKQSGFEVTHIGNAVSLWELGLLPQRFEAMQSLELPAEHRKFLMELEFDRKGIPHRRGQVAGIDGCYELRK
jgi:ubiquinone/menaquinone biosynthesis C-methylase UbiE